MNKKAWTAAKANLRTMGVLAFATFILMIGFTLSMVTTSATGTSVWMYPYGIIYESGPVLTSITILSPVNALWALPILAAFVVPTLNFRRIINLGGKRSSFFWGSLLAYVILVGLVSLINTVSSFAIEPIWERSRFFGAALYGGTIVNVTEGAGWAARGPVVAFIQQFGFLFLITVCIHTLMAVQGKWYGWAANVVIVCVFIYVVYALTIPAIPLRAGLYWFGTLVLFHHNAAVQIFACLALATGVYALNMPIFNKKAV
ncbi:MAG: hypothetical protein FWC77_02450 [Defluviitaleaceae bacterium]|nr:hypothetical protein [Defluviitaleaceae bacterium]